MLAYSQNTQMLIQSDSFLSSPASQYDIFPCNYSEYKPTVCEHMFVFLAGNFKLSCRLFLKLSPLHVSQLQLEFIFLVFVYRRRANCRPWWWGNFFYFVLLSLLLHCNDVIHVFISVAIHMHTLEILENECHSDIPKGEYFCKLLGRYMEKFSDWHNSLPLCLSHDFMYLYGKFS